MKILAIDPGNIQSGYVVLEVPTMKILKFGKIDNEDLLEMCRLDIEGDYMVAIEYIASYGMAVGQTIFDTCVYIGKLSEALKHLPIQYIFRKEEKINLCGTMKAKDTNIRQALIDRFGVVGTKNNQGYFYGFKSDIWSAFAISITFYDLYYNKKGDA